MMNKIAFIGHSQAHLRLLEILNRVAPTEAEVLISGPTGVGKERYAQYIHQKSTRNKGPFVPINCGAFPGDLFENEMFGHVGGAFTGAKPNNEGLACQAEHGTLFLDEVDSLPLPAQVKLLRLIQEKEYRKLGETKLRQADLRIIAATNTDLLEAVQAGRFRQDLFFRLRVVPVEVPPLCQRPEDIALLIEAYAEHYAKAYQLPKVGFDNAAYRSLLSYPWPGNIRELENCLHYLTCLQLNRPIHEDDLLLVQVSRQEQAVFHWKDVSPGSFQKAKKKLVDEFERGYLESALRLTSGNIAAAAKASGKPRRAFFELLKKHGIVAEDFRQYSPKFPQEA